jgi:hypothetical protein
MENFSNVKETLLARWGVLRTRIERVESASAERGYACDNQSPDFEKELIDHEEFEKRTLADALRDNWEAKEEVDRFGLGLGPCDARGFTAEMAHLMRGLEV